MLDSVILWLKLHILGDPLVPHLFGSCTSGTSKSLTWKSEWVKVLVTQSCPALCDSMDCSPPGSSVCGILKNTGKGSHSLLQEIFLTQGSKLGLPHFRQIFFLLSGTPAKSIIALSSQVLEPVKGDLGRSQASWLISLGLRFLTCKMEIKNYFMRCCEELWGFLFFFLSLLNVYFTYIALFSWMRALCHSRWTWNFSSQNFSNVCYLDAT